MKILAFGASTSSKSINQQLAKYAAEIASKDIVPDAYAEILDLNDFEMPIYSSDREESDGIPKKAEEFLAKIASADVLIISFAEHNGSYSAAYKNTFDWASRIGGKVYANKPMIVLSTSPGPGGAKSVLAAAETSMPHFGATVLGSMSLPTFYDSFDTSAGELTDAAEASKLFELLGALKSIG